MDLTLDDSAAAQSPATPPGNAQTPGPFRNSKFDNTEALRDEIEARTRHGETCRQIAVALAEKGINVSAKTISRRRVDWGLRKRVYKVGYTPLTNQDYAARKARVALDQRADQRYRRRVRVIDQLHRMRIAHRQNCYKNRSCLYAI